MADKIADSVHELYETARREADTKWRKDFDVYWAYYMALQWPSERASYRCDVVPNLAFSNIETIKPILTDQRPNFMVLPRSGGDPHDREVAQTGNAALRYLWDVSDMDLKLPEGLTPGLALGTAFWMVYFDKSLNGGLGEINVAHIHPKLNHPDPAGTDMRDIRYNIVESIVPLSILREMYGKKAGEVKGDVSLEDLYSRLGTGGVLEATSQGLPSYGQGTTPPTTSVPYLATNVPEGGDMVRLLRCWVRPGGSRGLGGGAESPGGRLIHVANHVVLRDVPNPFCWCPVVRFVDHALPSTFWGMGEIQETLTIQKALNSSLARLTDHSALCGNPRILCDASIYEEIKDKLTNKPAEIVPIENPDHVPLDSLIHWQVPPSIPLYSMRLIEIYQRLYEIVSGVHDVTQGRAPAGIEAGIAIEALQVETKRRIGLKVRNMESTLKGLGKLLLSAVETFWTTDRMLEIVGKDGPQGVNKGLFEHFEYDVRVEAGSSLPVDKAMAVREAEELVKMGVYDEEQLLEVKDPPNKQELKTRMKPLWDLKKAVAMAGMQKQLALATAPEPMMPPGGPPRGGPGGIT